MMIHSEGNYWLRLDGDRENLDSTFGVRLEFSGEEIKALMDLVKERAADRVRMTRKR